MGAIKSLSAPSIVRLLPQPERRFRLIPATPPEQDGDASSADGRGHVILQDGCGGDLHEFHLVSTEIDDHGINPIHRHDWPTFSRLAAPVESLGGSERVWSGTETDSSESAARGPRRKGPNAIDYRESGKGTGSFTIYLLE